MRILVTGGAGYVGSTLIRRALDRGHEVLCYDDLSAGSILPLLPFFHHRDRFRYVRGDLRDGDLLRSAVLRADAVVHLAALVGYPGCSADPERAHGVNVQGTETLARHVGPDRPVVFSSTGNVYGAVADEVCTEKTPTRPLTEYGRTKLEGERRLLDSCRCVVLRFATGFGLSARPRLDVLVNNFCHLALTQRKIVLYQAGYLRTFIHVYDMARAILYALENHDAMGGEIYNCGNPALNLTKLDVAEAIRRQLDFDLVFAETGRDEDQRDYEVSYRKLAAAGFRARVGLEQGIAEMLDAFVHLHPSDLPVTEPGRPARKATGS